MVGAVSEGVGVSLGSYLAGLAWSKVSGSLTFRYFGFGVLLACAVHLLVQYLLNAKGKDDRGKVVQTESTDALNNTDKY